jgi:hypothetical protein
MINVEQPYSRFHWAEPLRDGKYLEVKQDGADLHIKGLYPSYKAQNLPTDLIGQYRIAAKYRPVGGQRTTEESPQIIFANADTDDKLTAFVRRFGPVVAKSAYEKFEESPDEGPRSVFPRLLFAVQDMQELRNEQLIYRCALALVMRLIESDFDFASSQLLIRKISAQIADWPRQWEREKSQLKRAPFWNFSADSLKRIKALSSGGPDALLPPTVDGRIVLCELVNSFPAILFPNPLEMHSSIKYGIRPLLYAILRRQIVAPRDFSACANNHCRNFFDIERAGQQFCSPDCSIHQRQRTYWAKRGKKLRKKRVRAQRKAKA